MAWTAAWSMALPPSACTFTSCTPVIAAADKTAPATVLGMSWNFRSRKTPGPKAVTSRTAAGNSWLPILNMPTRSATCLANLTAEFSESKSSATIRLLRGWASKVKVFGGRDLQVNPSDGAKPRLAPLGQLHQFKPDLADARVNQTDLPGDTVGYINFASFLIRTAVVNSYHFKLAVPWIDDTH